MFDAQRGGRDGSRLRGTTGAEEQRRVEQARESARKVHRGHEGHRGHQATKVALYQSASLEADVVVLRFPLPAVARKHRPARGGLEIPTALHGSIKCSAMPLSTAPSPAQPIYPVSRVPLT